VALSSRLSRPSGARSSGARRSGPPSPGASRPVRSPLRATPPRRRRRRRPRLPLLLLAGAVTALIWMSRGWWFPSPPPPQMILVLGGDKDREIVAADLAARRGLPVVVSGGTNPEYAHWLFQERARLPEQQVRLDYRAQDTLSNFTSLVDDLRRARIRHALLVTSSDHMDRALLVGRIVAGSRGIHLTPVPVSCGDLCVPERRRLVWGDGARAVVWVLSGRDVRRWAEEQLGPWLQGAGLERSGPGRAGR
jgi:uncharacterized SAM-binding protein YcdF (DUF218 family)